ncbi:MAG: hypothetical protein D6776_01845, partial [Planctomycetota bacterium]
MYRVPRAPAIVAIGFVAALFAPLSGCQNVEKFEIPNIFRTVPDRPLADVPVPVGFRYQQRGSYIFDNNFRVARLRYTGTPWVEDVVAFFNEQMPLSRWRALPAFTRDGKQVLAFVNDRERCEITLDRRRGLTEIVIDITPRKTS